ncbi:MAG: hypothetical protein FWG64_05020 [Firmicutes bacterium]|nr:hypothetical protein [Bacillota bacterium]
MKYFYNWKSCRKVRRQWQIKFPVHEDTCSFDLLNNWHDVWEDWEILQLLDFYEFFEENDLNEEILEMHQAAKSELDNITSQQC